MFLDWVSAIRDSDLEKKDVGWMAMRGSWGRKKRNSIGSGKVTPIHEPIPFENFSRGVEGPNLTDYQSYQKLIPDKFVKKSIPKIDEEDIKKLGVYFNKLQMNN